MLTLTDVEQCSLSIAPKDAKGFPAVVLSAVWAVSDPTILSITAAADGLSAVLTAVAPGTAQASVQADGLTARLDVTVTGSGATMLTINTDAPVVVPPPAVNTTTTPDPVPPGTDTPAQP